MSAEHPHRPPAERQAAIADIVMIDGVPEGFSAAAAAGVLRAQFAGGGA